MSTPQAKIRFRAIELLSVNIVRRPDNLLIIPSEFHFDVNAELRVNPDLKFLLIIVNINAREINTENVIASISVGCVFDVENFDEIVKKGEGNVFNVPPELDALLKSISISTTRGVMYSEFKGTYLTNAVLPVIILPPTNQQMPDAQVVQLERSELTEITSPT
jgi:hypothetical protein